MATEVDVFALSLFGKQEIEEPKPTKPEPIRPARGTFWDHSGTITTANVSQLVMRENAQRRYLLLQNVGTATLWFNFTGQALKSQPSIELPAGASFVMESSFVTTEAINVISDTASAPFVAKEA